MYFLVETALDEGKCRPFVHIVGGGAEPGICVGTNATELYGRVVGAKGTQPKKAAGAAKGGVLRQGIKIEGASASAIGAAVGGGSEKRDSAASANVDALASNAKRTKLT